MIEAIAPTGRIRKAYDLWSYCYDKISISLEHEPRMRGLELAAIRLHDRVLEVAVGTGMTLVEILKRVDETNFVCGVDLSPKMLAKARRAANAAGYSNVDLREADARRLPFQDDEFDVLYNSYMLDLMPLNDMPLVLKEFRRVLKPGGRLVLVNMSKRDESKLTFWERFYRSLPAGAMPYLLGGCRPVLMESLVKQIGFFEVAREFMSKAIPSEVVTAKKPLRKG
jgi:demethylmenaquinone methyltransferase/2-methoxy-6-polyprenyl-1,4-benzoquinol methylase